MALFYVRSKTCITYLKPVDMYIALLSCIVCICVAGLIDRISTFPFPSDNKYGESYTENVYFNIMSQFYKRSKSFTIHYLVSITLSVVKIRFIKRLKRKFITIKKVYNEQMNIPILIGASENFTSDIGFTVP